MTGQAMVDAADLGEHGHAYVRLREARWANPDAYLRISVLANPDGTRAVGPWAHLFDRRTQVACELPTPQPILTLFAPFDLRALLHEDHVPWTGAIDEADR